MKQIYLSTYCVLFQDYAFLKRCVEQFPDFPVGIEFATYWPTPDFDRLLAAQIPAFAGRPATLHAPFVEICTEPGSPEEAFMELTFQKACTLYPQFGASSMVMHTHEGSFPAAQADSRRARSTEVLQAWTERMLRQGISITVENVGYPGKDNVLFDEAQFVALFDRLPAGAGCLIDIGHALLNHWDIPALIARMGTRIRGYHLNNNDGVHDSHLPLYEAGAVCPEAEMDRILRAIARYTPQADLILEYAPGPHVTAEGLYRDIRRVEQLTR